MQFKSTVALSLLLGFTSFSQAQIFEATGYGDTAELAKKDAVTNAIKLSVGEFVINKEELSNEDFNQKIVSHSNAYVKKIRVKSQDKKDSQFIVTVEVDIESQKLIETLREKKTAVVSDVVDQNMLQEVKNHFDIKDIKANNLQDFSNLVDELLINPIKEQKEIVHIKILGKLKPLTPEEGSEYFPVELPIRISIDDNYVKSIKRIIKEMEIDKNKIGEGVEVLHYKLKDADYIRTYINLDSDKMDILYLKKADYFDDKNSALTITLLDDNGDVIRELTNSAGDMNFQRLEMLLDYTYATNFEKSKVDPSNNLLMYTGNHKLVFSSGSADLGVVFALNKDEIKLLKDIKVEYV